MANLAPWPNDKPTWLEPWVIWRFRNKPAPKPLIIPKEIPKWAWSFLQWCEWKRNGSIPATRPQAPLPIPSGTYPWVVLKHLNQAVPATPPPPPPPPTPPPLPVPENSWKLPLPIMWTAWGWLSDGEFRDSNVALQKMADAGVKTVAVQGGQADASVAGRIRDMGMHVAMWGLADSRDTQWLAELQAEGYIPQIEGPYQYESTIANLRAGVGRGLSISTVTTLSGLGEYISRSDGSRTTVGCEALAEAGCTHAFTECYGMEGDGRYGNIPAMMDTTKRLNGFYHANPLIGVYWGWRPAMYDLSEYGRQYGLYLAEPMTPEAYSDLAAS